MRPTGQTPEDARDILLRFCRTTSLRGIPRIVSAENRPLRVLWLVFVASLVLGCTVNLWQIVSQYLAFDVVQMPSHEQRWDAEFPSITVCNQVPLSLQGRKFIYRNRWRSPRQYWQALMTARSEVDRLPNLTADDRELVQKFMPGFISLNSYFSNIPSGHAPSDLGFTLKQLVRSCFLTVWRQTEADGKLPVSSPRCADFGTWRRVHDQSRLNCYSFSASSSEPVVEMEMLLYLGHELGLGCDDCTIMDPNTQIMGARIVLHQRGSFPDVTKQGLNVYPGTLTEVRFTSTNWTQLSRPYGECRHKVPGPLRIFGHDFAYSIDACKKLHHQEYIEKNCSCTLSSMPHSMDRNASAMCERLDSNINAFTSWGLVNAVKRTHCGLLGSFRPVDYHCPLPCNYITFDVSTTQAMWPRDSMQLRFFQSELLPMLTQMKAEENSSIGSATLTSPADLDGMSIIRMYDEVIRAMRHSRVNATRLVIDNKLVSRSLLRLRISRKDLSVLQIVDKPVRTLASTLSQTGGLLSMWIGLTLVWLVEILELLIKLVAHAAGRRGRGPVQTTGNDGAEQLVTRPLTAKPDGAAGDSKSHAV